MMRTAADFTNRCFPGRFGSLLDDSMLKSGTRTFIHGC